MQFVLTLFGTATLVGFLCGYFFPVSALLFIGGLTLIISIALMMEMQEWSLFIIIPLVIGNAIMWGIHYFVI